MNTNEINVPPRDGTKAADPVKMQTAKWLAANGKYLGVKLLKHLFDDPDTNQNVETLASRIWKNSVPRRQTENPTTQTWGDPIPMIDFKTLSQCKKEAKRYIARIAAAQELGDDELAEKLKGEYAELLKYIKECTKPSGRIKNFPDLRVREYQRMYQAIQRVLRKARKESPEVYQYIKNHLKMGYTFAWIKEGLRRNLKG